jgi:hypothetical protein
VNRRTFLAGSAAAAATPLAAAPSKQQYIQLRFYDLHNDSTNQRRRLADYFENVHLPMTKRLGVGPVGYFQVYLGPNMPTYVILGAFDSMAAIQEAHRKLATDKQWKAEIAKHKDAAPLFDRSRKWLLQAFSGMPRLEAPKIEEGKKPRFFDLRIYESVSLEAHLRKVDMFNSGGEIAIFRRTGLNPVFFGRTIYGEKMPNLTYMLWYDDMAAREKAWAKFRDDPDWKRISKDPKWAGTVSNITNTHLQPLSFSPIR